jgi:RNA polymerase sigma-70 factor (ECF subfamily)
MWLLGIARRKVAASLRVRYRRAELPLTFAGESTHDERRHMEQNALVRQVLGQLPIDQREALVLKYANGMSTREVADVLGRSEAATNSLLQRGREAFYTKGLHLFRDDQEVDHVSR